MAQQDRQRSRLFTLREPNCDAVRLSPNRLIHFYDRANSWCIGNHAPFWWLLATDCWMKYMPSTPS